jgi:hypothetical protein
VKGILLLISPFILDFIFGIGQTIGLEFNEHQLFIDKNIVDVGKISLALNMGICTIFES